MRRSCFWNDRAREDFRWRAGSREHSASPAIREPRRETVTQDSSAFAVFDPATRAFRTEGIRRMPIEQFRARVAAAIARAQERTR